MHYTWMRIILDKIRYTKSHLFFLSMSASHFIFSPLTLLFSPSLCLSFTLSMSVYSFHFLIISLPLSHPQSLPHFLLSPPIHSLSLAFCNNNADSQDDDNLRYWLEKCSVIFTAGRTIRFG